MIREYRNGDQGAILRIYRAAFAGPPWYEVLSEAEVAHRWVVSLTKSGFGCLVAQEVNEIIGATWWNMPTIDILRQEQGVALADFAQGPIPVLAQWKTQPVTVVWFRETIVAPHAQGHGVAKDLKEWALEHMRYWRKPVLVLTRMRDDNAAIIRLNERLGFKRTGIRMPSSQKPGIMHEYWYLLITSSGEPYLSG